ncbi:MAG: hypothetical protein KDB01_27810 [Planctomycetaceae bacterium]|nr:hypothetical protein [Planctomycetaceae bacterium]
MKRSPGCCCCCAKPVLVDWVRHMHIVGPLHADTTLPAYTNEWTWNSPLPGKPEPAWCATVDFGSAPDDHPFPNKDHWNRKMKPVRWELSTSSEMPALSGSTFLDGLLSRYRQVSDAAHPAFGVAVLDPPIHYPPATRGSVPLDGHFKGSKISQIVTGVPFGSLAAYTSRATFIRVNVDGVDVSGVVPISVLITRFDNAYDFIAASTVGVSFPEVDVTDKPITIDIWFEVDVVTNTGAGPAGMFTAAWANNGTHPGQFANVVAHYHNFVRGVNGLNINAKRAATRKYRFDFSAAITDGATSVSTTSGSPWTLLRTDLSAKLSHSNGTDYVQLFYGQEIAEILLARYQTIGSETRIWIFRYFPVNSGHYTGPSPGIFDPSGSNTFALHCFSANGVDFETNIAGVSAYAPATIVVSPTT